MEIVVLEYILKLMKWIIEDEMWMEIMVFILFWMANLIAKSSVKKAENSLEIH